MKRNKRVVISGSPGAGKTSIIECLSQKGYTTFEEYSRNLIEDAQRQGTPNFFLSDPIIFSEKIFRGRQEQFEAAKKLTKVKNDVLYYDRGIHDTLAYLGAIEQNLPWLEKKVLEFQYDLVFLVNPWEEIYKKDDQRLETFEQAKTYYPFIKKVYEKQHQVIELPQVSVSERISFIESFVNDHG